MNLNILLRRIYVLDPVKIDAHESIKEMLKFFMGKNTPERQQYIIRNLRYELISWKKKRKILRMKRLNGKKVDSQDLKL